MPAKRKKVASRKKLSAKKIQKGTIGNFFVFGVLALLLVLGITAVGGLPSTTAPETGQVVMAITPTPGTTHSNLQLKWFGYVTIAPTPTPVKTSLCNNKSVNTEQELIDTYFPGLGQTTGANGQIKVWINDEFQPFISYGEQINKTTGAITQYGNTNAKAPDGYLWEPSLYIAPDTAESGGAPHFPDYIKGVYNNSPPSLGKGNNGPKPDLLPAGTKVSDPGYNKYEAEYIWNVSKLALTTGNYQAEFVIHDGDIDRAVGCVTITIK